MPPNAKRKSRKRLLLDLMAERGWSVIGEAEWQELVRTIPALRSEDLRSAGAEAEAPWHGVRQHTIDELETTLTALAATYETRPDLRRFCRTEVIRAKDRARIISVAGAVDDERRQLKREMVEWMLVWLGDPSLFASWARVRRNQMNSQGNSNGLS